MEQGTPFALAHTFFQTGPFRPNNVDKRVPGLVFTGSSTLPGVGVPMVLVSGKLAAERVDEFAQRSEMRWPSRHLASEDAPSASMRMKVNPTLISHR